LDNSFPVRDVGLPAEQAAQSRRRPDLEKALATRQDADQLYEKKKAQYAAFEDRLHSIIRELKLGIDEAPHPVLMSWLKQQAQLRQLDRENREDRGKLEQLLDGATLEELSHQLTADELQAGQRPDHLPYCIETELAESTKRREVASQAVSRLNGEAATLQARLPSVAQALEKESEAEQSLENVKNLERLLDVAQNALQLAKEHVNANIAPALTQKMRPWLPRITRGATPI